MAWGDQLEFLQNVVTAQLGHEPPALRDRPVQNAENDYILEAFNILSRGRRSIDEPIQVSEIIAYAKAMQISDIHSFIVLIQAADEAYRTDGLSKSKHRH